MCRLVDEGSIAVTSGRYPWPARRLKLAALLIGEQLSKRSRSTRLPLWVPISVVLVGLGSVLGIRGLGRRDRSADDGRRDGVGLDESVSGAVPPLDPDRASTGADFRRIRSLRKARDAPALVDFIGGWAPGRRVESPEDTTYRRRVRVNAIHALGSLDDPVVGRTLRKLIEADNEQAARLAAVDALARDGDQTDVRWLRSRSEAADLEPVVRDKIVSALERHGR